MIFLVSCRWLIWESSRNRAKEGKSFPGRAFFVSGCSETLVELRGQNSGSGNRNKVFVWSPGFLERPTPHALKRCSLLQLLNSTPILIQFLCSRLKVFCAKGPIFNLDKVEKQGLTLISFHARHCLFNLLLLFVISATKLQFSQAESSKDYWLKVSLT